MGTPWTSAEFVKLTDNVLREVANDQENYKDLQSAVSDIFSRKTSQKRFEEFFSISQLPDIPVFTGQLTYLPRYPGWTVKIEHKEYAGGVQSERKLVDDEHYGVLIGNTKDLMRSYYRTQEKSAVRLIGYADSAAFDFMTSEEGVALASNSHLSRSGASTSSGFDNYTTSALNKTNLEAARLQLERLKTDIGERFQTSGKYAIIGGSTVMNRAMEIIRTPKGFGTAAQDYNVEAHIGYSLIHIPRLDDIDTNNWALVDVERMKRSCAFYDRIKPEYDHTIDFETKSIKHSCYGRFAWGWNDWRWGIFNFAA